MKMRYGRLKAQGKPEDPKSYKAFKWLDTRERRGFMKAKSEEKHGVMHIINDADYVIANTSTVGKFEDNLDKVVKKIKEINKKNKTPRPQFSSLCIYRHSYIVILPVPNIRHPAPL